MAAIPDALKYISKPMFVFVVLATAVQKEIYINITKLFENLLYGRKMKQIDYDLKIYNAFYSFKSKTFGTYLVL